MCTLPLFPLQAHEKLNGFQLDFLQGTDMNGYWEEEFLTLEQQVIQHYVDTFFLYFGRAPIVPRHLPHVPDISLVPETEI